MTAEPRVPSYAHCRPCGVEWVMVYLPLDAAKAGRIMKKRSCCPMCGSHKNVYMGRVPVPTALGDLEGWPQNGDTGTSSLTIWHTLYGVPAPAGERLGALPLDPSDFGRCYRLLAVAPSWRDRLGEVADRFPAWRPMVDAWAELTALYEEELPSGTAPRLYKRMQELLT